MDNIRVGISHKDFEVIKIKYQEFLYVTVGLFGYSLVFQTELILKYAIKVLKYLCASEIPYIENTLQC